VKKLYDHVGANVRKSRAGQLVKVFSREKTLEEANLIEQNVSALLKSKRKKNSEDFSLRLLPHCS
jgi:hypothetical protein